MITKELHIGNLEIFYVECDLCGADETFETYKGWNNLLAQMRDSGWQSRTVKNEWEHYCPDCAQT